MTNSCQLVAKLLKLTCCCFCLSLSVQGDGCKNLDFHGIVSKLSLDDIENVVNEKRQGQSPCSRDKPKSAQINQISDGLTRNWNKVGCRLPKKEGWGRSFSYFQVLRWRFVLLFLWVDRRAQELELNNDCRATARDHLNIHG
jgi:hypothetical protein